MNARHASFIITVNFHHQNEQIIALLQQLIAQNEELSKKVADLQAKVELLEHKFDTIAEEAGST
jgi:cell division protein FtsB